MPSSELKPGDLSKLASDVLIGNGVACPWYLAGKIADAAVARWPHVAGPQRITTVEELDSLQTDPKRTEGVVIRAADGIVYKRDVDNSECEAVESAHAWWWQMGSERDDLDSTHITLPAVVLWSPEVTG